MVNMHLNKKNNKYLADSITHSNLAHLYPHQYLHAILFCTKCILETIQKVPKIPLEKACAQSIKNVLTLRSKRMMIKKHTKIDYHPTEKEKVNALLLEKDIL